MEVKGYLIVVLIWNFEGIWGSGEMTYSRNAIGEPEVLEALSSQ